jgi:hypothetical protein
MATNRRLVDKEGADFYPTPPWGTKALLKYEDFEGTIHEPCCGDGSMSKVIEEQYPDKVISSDLYDRGYGSVQDVFSIEKCENFITNPPFNIVEDILEHALKITERKICLLLRTAFLESASRYNKFFKFGDKRPNRMYTFSQRLSMYPAGQNIKSGGTTSYSWFVWDKRMHMNDYSPTQLFWIETGLKE